jgi:tetratricopeptide (TPR) repeat protein
MSGINYRDQQLVFFDEVDRALRRRDARHAESMSMDYLRAHKSIDNEWFFSLGMVYYKNLLFKEAAIIFNRAHSTAPDNLKFALQLARSYQMLGHYGKSEAILRPLLSSDAHNDQVLTLLAICADVAGKHENALALIDRAIIVNGDNADAKYLKVSLLINAGYPDSAISLLDHIVNRHGDSDRVAALRSFALERQGKCQEAFAAVEPLMPNTDLHSVALAYGRAAMYCDTNIIRESFNGIKKWLKKNESFLMSNQDRSSLLFTLGDLSDKLENVEEAYKCYLEANSFARVERYDRSTVSKFVNRCMRYEPNNIRGVGNDRENIFIVGMPRSGSSLIEKMLVKSGKIFGHGEPGYVGSAVRQISNGDVVNYLGFLDNLNKNSVLSLAKELKSAYRLVGGNLKHADKMLFNYQFVPLIMKLFPDARIVHVVRDYRDVALSCFAHSFSGYHPYKFSISDIIFQFRSHLQIMNRWKRLFPHNIITIEYERLVSYPTPVMSEIAKFIGINPNYDFTKFYELNTACITSSYSQVKQPLYRTAVGRWRLYQNMIDFEQYCSV